MKPGNIELHKFSHLLVEARNKYSKEMKILQQTHDIVEFVECFNNIGIQHKSLFPVKIKTKPCVFILKRKANMTLDKLEDILLKENYDEEYDDGNEHIKVGEDIDLLNEIEPEMEIEVNSERKERHKIKRKIQNINKIIELLEKHYLEENNNIYQNGLDSKMSNNLKRTKAKIHKIVKNERIAEQIKKIDLNAYCDLDRTTVNECFDRIVNLEVLLKDDL